MTDADDGRVGPDPDHAQEAAKLTGSDLVRRTL